MNKKILGVFVSLLVVAMLTLPMSAVFGTKPEPYTDTLTGTFYVNTDEYEVSRRFDAGESGNTIIKYKGLLQVWDGDIAGDGTYDGNWVLKNPGTPEMEVNTVGIQIIEGAVVDGIGTGDLKIKSMDTTLEIISGTGDLKGIKGTGFIVFIDWVTYDYVLDVQINP